MQVVKRIYKIIAVAGFCLQTLAVTGLYAQNKFPGTVDKKIGPGRNTLDKYQTKPIDERKLKVISVLPAANRGLTDLSAAALQSLVAENEGQQLFSTVGEGNPVMHLKAGDLNTPLKPLRPLSASFYTDNFGFFCKQELRIEKATRIPFRFRLGSLAACNAIEGK